MCGVGEEADLHPRHALELVWVQAPPEFHPTAQHPRVRAGCIHEDAIEFRRRRRQGGDRRDTGDAKPFGIPAEQGEASLGRVMGHDPARIGHTLRDAESLAPGCGTEVEDGLVRLGGQFTNRQEGAGILQVESTVLEASQVGDGSNTRQLMDGSRLHPVQAPFLMDDSFGIPASEEFLGGVLQSVHPGEEWRGGVDPTAQGLELFGAVPGRPSGDEPGGQRPSPGEVPALQLLEALEGRFTIPDHVPQDGIHEARLRGESEAPRQFHGVVDRGVIRDPVEPKELIDPQTEQSPWNRRDRASIGARGDQFVEDSSPSEHAEDELLCESSISGFEAREHGVFLESPLREITRLLLSDKKQGGKFSWCGNHREGILPFLR